MGDYDLYRPVDDDEEDPRYPPDAIGLLETILDEVFNSDVDESIVKAIENSPEMEDVDATYPICGREELVVFFLENSHKNNLYLTDDCYEYVIREHIRELEERHKEREGELPYPITD